MTLKGRANNQEYTEDYAIAKLRDNKCKVIRDSKTIEVSTRMGLATWGYISFLCNYCGYHWIKVKGDTHVPSR